MTNGLWVDVPIFHSRYQPMNATVEAARALHASGVIDSVDVHDQLMFFGPPSLWNAETSPLAAQRPDLDSWADPYQVLAYIAAAVPGVGLCTTSDAVRRGPAEFMQSLLTLADISGGKCMVQMGAGEIKQCKPYGHKRSEGLKRLEDTMAIYRKFLDADTPIDYDGNIWKLQQAWIGGARNNRPQLWALGDGPKLRDIATSYADGFCSVTPFGITTPESAATTITEMKQQLEDKGRDPEEFGFGLWCAMLLHEDDAIGRALNNPYLKWMTAVLGRMNQAAWADEGLPSPMGDKWHYALHLLPLGFSQAEIEGILSRTTAEHFRRSWFAGTPSDVADKIRPYIEAGVNYVQLLDLMPLALDPEEAPQSRARAIELAQMLKTDPTVVGRAETSAPAAAT
jgi:phthiodiolone/phenolphthiodiolone dimycocerosates ketoreductase